MQEEFKRYSESPGALRASQIITTFGPGAVVQMEHDSVLVMGIDTWNKSEDYYKKLGHPYLEQLLEKSHFKMPRQVGRHRVLSCRSFPLWGVCSNPVCAMLQKHKAAPPDGKRLFSCRDCGREIYAAKFAAVCSNGHLEEFPWNEWAHSRIPERGICDRHPRLQFRQRGNSPGLADYFVTCLDCKASRSCAGATSRSGLEDIISGCNGAMPWIGHNVTTECSDGQGNPTPVYGIHIRSTSMYYPVTVTALYVPEWLHPVQKCITESKELIRSQLGISTARVVAEKSELLEKVRETHTIDEIEGHLIKRFNPRPDLNKDSTEAQVRNREYGDLMLSEFEGDEYLEIAEVAVVGELAEYVRTLKQIKRLTEIRVMRAFTREAPADPYLSEGQSVKYCPISGRNTDWYPAIENRGEGFLFTLNEERLCRWEGKPAVRSRCGMMRDAFGELFSDMDQDDPRRPPRYTLLHTLAHVLIRGVAAVSGYSEASIRERIYSGGQHSGILLYTATPSSDGSLGGLVRQGKTENFASLLRASVRGSTRCSRDPLCAEDDPGDMARASAPLYTRINASACYGCVLLPETSCENVNRLLDRRLLFDKEFGYFRDWAELI